MNNLQSKKREITEQGYCIIEDVFNSDELEKLAVTINSADKSNPAFRVSKHLFAIRQFLKEIPEARPLIFNANFDKIVNRIFGEGFFVVKSIYFDKPEESNWFVAWHQDLTIAVDKKDSISGYDNWTVKQDQFAVQPPLKVLDDNFTVRIHLDETNQDNGALKVIPGSHLKGIYRPQDIDFANETIDLCSVTRGGIMIMRPLLMHASDRTTNGMKRRVIHIEFSCAELPADLNWAELN
jgi:ectoine hydroxylase-related dioxygenase (phytanoyl-CoA dioxygenase family)